MAGLDPAIHVLKQSGHVKTWIPGTSPGMTAKGTEGSDDVAVEELDQHVLRAADKGDADAGADRLRLDREFGALRLQFGASRVDIPDPEPEMVEPDKTALGLFRQSRIGRDLGDKDHDAAELHVGALDAVRHHRFDDLRAERPLVIG